MPSIGDTTLTMHGCLRTTEADDGRQPKVCQAQAQHELLTFNQKMGLFTVKERGYILIDRLGSDEGLTYSLRSPRTTS